MSDTTQNNMQQRFLDFADYAIGDIKHWKSSGGAYELKRARYFIDLLIEHDETKGATVTSESIAGAFMPFREWPEKYEVGMKFRTAGGTIQTVSKTIDAGAYMLPNNWWYKHGGKEVAILEDDDTQDALVEYLGKL